RLRNENSGPLDGQAVANVFQRIIDESLNLQMKRFQPSPQSSAGDVLSVPGGRRRVAFLGERGTFSEMAAIGLLGDSHDYVSVANFTALYDSIASGAADMLISPLENSIVGSIQRCYDLLLESSLAIVAEIT